MQLSAGCDSCKIYDRRPEVCAGYACLWLAGYGKTEDRPDRCGMLMDTTHRIPNAIECKQLFDGAADTPRGRAAIKRISRAIKRPAIVLAFYEKRIARIEGKPA